MTRYNNFKHNIELQLDLTTEEKNMIINLHNEARGSTMFFEYLVKLEKAQKIDQGEAQKIFVLSVDWPQNVVVDKLKWII